MMSTLPNGGARLAALALALGCSGCLGGAAPGAALPTSVTAAASAPADGAELDATAFAAALQRPGTVILDVRTPAEFAAGHLVGAVNVDVNAADFRGRVSALAKDVPYAVYCRSGNRSATALAIMRQLGFTATYHLGGGIQAWTASGGKVVAG